MDFLGALSVPNQYIPIYITSLITIESCLWKGHSWHRICAIIGIPDLSHGEWSCTYYKTGPVSVLERQFQSSLGYVKIDHLLGQKNLLGL